MYTLCFQKFSRSENTSPTPTKNDEKNQFLGLKDSINNHFMLYFGCFYIRLIRYTTFNKTSTNKVPFEKFCSEKMGKMGIFNFADFHLKTHVSPFFQIIFLNYQIFRGKYLNLHTKTM